MPSGYEDKREPKNLRKAECEERYLMQIGENKK